MTSLEDLDWTTNFLSNLGLAEYENDIAQRSALVADLARLSEEQLVK